MSPQELQVSNQFVGICKIDSLHDNELDGGWWSLKHHDATAFHAMLWHEPNTTCNSSLDHTCIQGWVNLAKTNIHFSIHDIHDQKLD